MAKVLKGAAWTVGILLAFAIATGRDKAAADLTKRGLGAVGVAANNAVDFLIRVVSDFSLFIHLFS